MRKVVWVLVLTSLAAVDRMPARAQPVRCHVVTDPAGDGTRHVDPPGLSTPNEPSLDVLSADVGIGAKSMVFVVRVAALGSATSQGPVTERWDMNFELRGQQFATTATRAIDGADFRVLGQFPENDTAAPGAQTSVPVAGSFDEARNEITVVVPRRLLPILRPSKDSLTNLAVDSFSGAGITSERLSLATTVDQTVQPGPNLPINAKTCVPAA